MGTELLRTQTTCCRDSVRKGLVKLAALESCDVQGGLQGTQLLLLRFLGPCCVANAWYSKTCPLIPSEPCLPRAQCLRLRQVRWWRCMRFCDSDRSTYWHLCGKMGSIFFCLLNIKPGEHLLSLLLIVLNTELLAVGTSFFDTSLLLCSSFLEHSSVSETSRSITAFPRNLQQFQLHPVSRPSPDSNLSWINSKWFQSTTCCWWQATTEQAFIDQWRVVSKKAMAPLGFGRKPKGADGKEVPYTFKSLWYRVVKIPIGPGLFSIDSTSVIELGGKLHTSILSCPSLGLESWKFQWPEDPWVGGRFASRQKVLPSVPAAATLCHRKCKLRSTLSNPSIST